MASADDRATLLPMIPKSPRTGPVGPAAFTLPMSRLVALTSVRFSCDRDCMLGGGIGRV